MIVGASAFSLGIVILSLGGFLILMGAIGLFLAWRLYGLRAWARTGTIIISSIGIFLGLAYAALGNPMALLNALINAVVLGYLLLPGVKRAFASQAYGVYVSRRSWRFGWGLIVALLVFEGVLLYFAVNMTDFFGPAMVLAPMIILTGTLVLIFLGNYETEPPAEGARRGEH